MWLELTPRNWGSARTLIRCLQISSQTGSNYFRTKPRATWANKLDCHSWLCIAKLQFPFVWPARTTVTQVGLRFRQLSLARCFWFDLFSLLTFCKTKKQHHSKEKILHISLYYSLCSHTLWRVKWSRDGGRKRVESSSFTCHSFELNGIWLCYCCWTPPKHCNPPLSLSVCVWVWVWVRFHIRLSKNWFGFCRSQWNVIISCFDFGFRSICLVSWNYVLWCLLFAILGSHIIEILEQYYEICEG